MSRQRALVVCPGRGSYERRSLGSLADRGDAANVWLDASDAWRRQHDRPTIRELDAADTYRATRHVAGEHASLLTFACSIADLTDINPDRFDIVGVCGNSMGWYTALAASGALPPEDAIELIDTMGAYQHRNVVGGQILYPYWGADWQVDPTYARSINHAMAAIRADGHVADWSIDLGGFAVLGADAAGVKRLLSDLPPIERGDRTFPIQLPMHSAFHTELMQPASDRARHDMPHLRFRAPDVPLIDGRGVTFKPHWASPGELAAYTLGHQVVRPYDFTTSLRTALRATAPDVVITLGPGNALGGPSARILCREGWRGIRSRADFDAHQNERPLLLSFGVSKQRELLV